ncbi:uncharacterized protein LOC123498945 isoform X1 [Portunus trituberculatus]|uniref:uncharacterized protein LOC123498945 isoform X1 n=1 Tax=Portunus trituberculatus TaxID=210409 RepID=UPI001E1D0E82|nr:uncharacterized protein LOC123498945 isoform X1 [Portunus trituberculatus]XP_045102461.1 uncharacterized protein LOC123498945 isoform X1 [Portunus trituberculatus]XP_045102462.1 uncharacterized protein LOC123498945 isoform X1 [Portunus trituberculatus]
MVTHLLIIHSEIRIKCCGLLWKAMANTKAIHTAQTYCQRVKSKAQYKHYLRSPYSLIHHYYKDLGTLGKAQQFVRNFPKLKRVPLFQLDHIFRLIKDDGYCWKEVERFKEVLLLTPLQYKLRVQLLQTLSLSQPSLYYVPWMTLLMDSTVKFSREDPKSIFKSDPIEHLIASSTDLNLPESTLQAARDLSNSDDTVTLKQVFLYLLKHYLAHRFSEDTEVVGSFLHSTLATYLWKPLYHYPVLCDLFIDSLELNFSEVQKQPQLFYLDPTNTKEILEKFPSIGGTPTREVAKAVPKVLQIPASHLVAWLRLLQKHKVHPFTCTYHTVALFKTSWFSEVGERLQTLKQLQEWEFIMVSEKMFELLRSQEQIKNVLNSVESGRIITSLSVAMTHAQHTNRHLCRSATPEVVSYAATALGLPPEEIREVLEEEIFTPYGLVNFKTVLWLLLDYGFTREQVLAGALVLNMEAAVVEQVLKDLHTRPEVQPFAEWMENPFILHLVAYCVRKDFPHMGIHIKNKNS